MRAALLLLVLVNLLLFFWWQGLLDAWIPGARDPARIERQVAPERLSVLPATAGASGAGAPGVAGTLAACHELGPLDAARRDAVVALIQGFGTSVRADAGETGIRLLIDASVPSEKTAEWLAAIAAEARQPVRPCIPPSVPAERPPADRGRADAAGAAATAPGGAPAAEGAPRAPGSEGAAAGAGTQAR